MRNSGKTYRAVLRAVADASEGKDILFISDTESHSDIAKQFATSFIKCVSIEVKVRENYMLFFQTGGIVQFITIDRYLKNKRTLLRGRAFDKKIKDLS